MACLDSTWTLNHRRCLQTFRWFNIWSEWIQCWSRNSALFAPTSFVFCCSCPCRKSWTCWRRVRQTSLWTQSSTQPALWTSNTTVLPSHPAEGDVRDLTRFIFLLYFSRLMKLDKFKDVSVWMSSFVAPSHHPEMSCLMEALQDKRVRLQPECKKRLQDRIDMWSYAAKVNTRRRRFNLVRVPTESQKDLKCFIQWFLFLFITFF